MTQAYQAQYDKEARGWNVIEVATGQIVGMFGGGNRGKQQAQRSAARDCLDRFIAESQRRA